MRHHTRDALVYAIVLAYSLIGVFLASLGVLVAKCFEYSLWSIFGKDVPWYLDLLGGILLNGLNIPIAIVCAIVRACGYDVPFIH